MPDILSLNINKLLYEKKYSELIELLESSNNIRKFFIIGEILLNSGNIEKAQENFEIAQCMWAVGYCKFLNAKLGEAKVILNEYAFSSSFSDWILKLINVINDNYSNPPTYFQIRNFYEQDLEMLYLYKRYSFINKIISKSKYFGNFNMEIYKYNGRFLYNHNYNEDAVKFLKKSLDIYYKDPETHFILGGIYEKSKDKESAIKSYKKSIEVNGEYYPALKRIKELEENII